MFIRDAGNYTQWLSRRSLHHVNMAAHALHFGAAELSPVELVCGVEYYTRAPYASRYASNSNVVAENSATALLPECV